MKYRMKRDSALFFLCSLIEYIGREQKRKRGEIAKALGEKMLRRIYAFADVLHSEPIAKVADEYIAICRIEKGSFDNIATCRFDVPDYWTIGEVYERLIADITTDDVIQALQMVYASWISEAISNYNTDFYYQPRDYIAECYRQGMVI